MPRYGVLHPWYSQGTKCGEGQQIWPFAHSLSSRHTVAPSHGGRPQYVPVFPTQQRSPGAQSSTPSQPIQKPQSRALE